LTEDPRPEHPKPMMRRDSWINLNGDWDFSIGNEGDEVEPDFSSRIRVPFPPESRLSGIGITDFMPVVWYRRWFRVPEGFKDRKLCLRFGAVDYDSTVWLNGEIIGGHKGGYTPFSFDVSGKMREGRNELVVRARDDNRTGVQPCGKQSTKLESHGCRYTRVTGIWQTVWMESVGPSHLVDITVGRTGSNRRLWAMCTLEGKPEGTLEARVEKEGKAIGSGQCPADRSAKIPIEMEEDVSSWSVDDPNLYDLEVTLRSEGCELDRVRTYFGFKPVKIQGGELLINGEKVFQRLVLDQGYYPEGIYTAPSDWDLRRDIEISKEMGFDGARLHQKVFEPRFLYWADRLGYLVWGEFPSWGIDMSDPVAQQNFISEWAEVLNRDINHPSVIGWCPFNETPRDQDERFIRSVYRMTKIVDPGRPVIDTSGYTHVITDVYDSHDYGQDADAFRERHSRILEDGEAYRNHPEHDVEYSGQPVMVSEFGGARWSEGSDGEDGWGYGDNPKSSEEFLGRFSSLTGALLDNPRMAGFCYTQLYDIEQEENGLYDYQRRPKFDPRRIREIVSRGAAYEESP